MNIKLSHREFNILKALANAREPLDQQQINNMLSYSLDIIHQTLNGLTEHGYVENSMITILGIQALEPYRVKRAIFIAAGFGSRLVPVTLNTPKPLIYINGKQIIAELINAVLAAGIEEIIIIRGYFAEQFDQLLYKYPMIKFIDNPIFNETNNISSAMCARHLLQNAYVFEADLFIKNPKIIDKYHYTSDFLAIKKERSDDWCFTTNDGIITEQKIGGLNCHQMVGISYWDETDGQKLSNHIKQAYEMPGGRELYWEQVPLKIFKNEYRVEVLECRDEDIVEIDTFSELKAIDKAYNVV